MYLYYRAQRPEYVAMGAGEFYRGWRKDTQRKILTNEERHEVAAHLVYERKTRRDTAARITL